MSYYYSFRINFTNYTEKKKNRLCVNRFVGDTLLEDI